MDIIELFLLSPHRALALSSFGVGLSRGLFRQLRSRRRYTAPFDEADLRVREWTVYLPVITQNPWQHEACEIVIDIVVVWLVRTMFWRNLYVTSFTMVPWRCEYTYLLPAWPIASIIWLLLSILLLHFMQESTVIFNAADPSIRYSWRDLICLSYSITARRNPRPCSTRSASSAGAQDDQEMASMSTVDPEAEPESRRASQHESRHGSRQESTPPDGEEPRETELPEPVPVPLGQISSAMRASGKDYVTIRIVMPSSFGLRSWRVYEAAIETAATGIYIYATFILTSLVFLNADKAMSFTAIMSFSLSVIRLLVVLF